MQMEKRAKMIAKMHAKIAKSTSYKPNNNNKKSKHDARPAAAQATAYVYRLHAQTNVKKNYAHRADKNVSRLLCGSLTDHL